MTNFSRFNKIVIGVAGLAAMLGMSACSGQTSSAPKLPPSEYIAQVEATIDGSLSSASVEINTAKEYCTVEKAYGVASPEVIQVVKATSERFGQGYFSRVESDGLVYPADGQGYVLRMMDRVSLGQSADSFCGLVDSGQLPSATMLKVQATQPAPEAPAPAPAPAPVTTESNAAITQRLKDEYSAATNKGGMMGADLHAICSVEKNFGMDGGPHSPGDNPAFDAAVDEVMNGSVVNNRTANERRLSAAGQDVASEQQVIAYNQFDHFPYAMSACQASVQFDAAS